MIIKKGELEKVLIQISGRTSDGRDVGLIYEKISLGLKRRLKQIAKELNGHFEQYRIDLVEAQKAGDKEVTILNKEEVLIDQEKVLLSMILEIESETNYDFDLIEKIAQ